MKARRVVTLVSSLGLTAGLVAPVASSAVAAPHHAAVVASVAVPTAVKLPVRGKKFKSPHARLGKRNSKPVYRLQTRLINQGYATKGLRRAGATGNYLKTTRNSVRKLQRSMGFTGAGADGILGPSSAAKLGLRWFVPARLASGGSAAPSAPSSGSFAVAPGQALSSQQLKAVLLEAGFTEPHIRTAFGIAMRESRGTPRIVGPVNGNGTRDHGLFQFNDVHRNTIDFAQIYDPVYNAKQAYRLSRGGTDWSHWGIGTQGWAGTLKRTQPVFWQFLQDEMVRFRAMYPG